MTNQEVHISIRERIADKKYIIINSLLLALTIAFCISLANRNLVELILAEHYAKVWLVHSFAVWPLIAGALFASCILVYGLFIDHMALDTKLRVLKPEKWKVNLVQIWENKSALALGALLTLILLGVQGSITYVIADVLQVQLLEVGLFQAFISSILLYLTAFKTNHVRESGLALNPVSLSIALYIIGFIYFTVQFYG